jgi:hypothetical protein
MDTIQNQVAAKLNQQRYDIITSMLRDEKISLDNVINGTADNFVINDAELFNLGFMIRESQVEDTSHFVLLEVICNKRFRASADITIEEL